MSFCSPKAAARLSSTLLLAFLASACSEREIMAFTLEQSLSIALKGQCDEDPQCLAAIESQLRPCIDGNPDIEALVKAGGQDEDLTRRVSLDIARCIVDAQGNSYFFAHTEITYEEQPDEPQEQIDDPPTIIPR